MVEIAFFIAWIGQACFVIEAGGTTLLTDPVPPKLGFASAPVAANVVTVSHEHFDHTYLGLAKGEPTVLRGLSNEGKDWATIRFENKDVKITAFPSYHDGEKGAKRGKNTMFLIETQGIRILHTGDLGHQLSEDTVKNIGRVDVLLICVGGTYTLDAKEAKSVVGQLKPRVVVPMHFKTGKLELPIATDDAFLRGWKNVRRSRSGRVALPKGLAGFPEGETTILSLPCRMPEAAPGRSDPEPAAKAK